MKLGRLSVLFLVLVAALATHAFSYSYGDYVWHTYGGHQYAATFSVGPWVDADTEARALGGHLVAINDVEENRWLAETFDQISNTNIYTPYGVWIGYEFVGGSWQWVNGEPTTFENICAVCWRAPGPHMYLTTISSPNSWEPYTWNYNHWHDTRASHYLHGIIELPYINTHPPTCNASGPYATECQDIVTTIELDGGGSTDPDLDPLSYLWTTDCPGGSFNDSTSATPTLFVNTSPVCLVTCNVSLIVTDSTGASDDPCMASVTIEDSAPPALAGVPMDVTVECDALPPPANVMASDTCDPSPGLGFAESAVPGACPQESVVIRTWTATDACGNPASATQTLTVVDSTAPVLTGVPVDTIVECGDIPPAASVSATDNCDQCLPTFFSEVQTGVCSLTLTRTWAVSDACGNTTSEIQTILVSDMTPPVATAGLIMLSSGDNEGAGGADHDDDEGIFAVVASCSDNCAGVGGCAAPMLLAVLACSNGQTVAVSPGAVVEIEIEDEGGCEIEVENGRLEIEGMVTLIVTCTDASGNTSTATAIPLGLAPDNDFEDEDDD